MDNLRKIVYPFIDNSFLFTKQSLSHMRALLGGPEGGMQNQKYMSKEVKNFSLRSQRVNLASSKSHKSKTSKPPSTLQVAKVISQKSQNPRADLHCWYLL